MNVASFLRTHAAERPEQPALRFPVAAYDPAAPAWDTWDFRTLDRESDALARGFVAAGIRPGDRAVLLIRPSLRFFATVFALFKVGAVPVVLDPMMGRQALLACIERTAPRVVLAMPVVHALRVTLARRAFAAAEVCVTDGARWFWGGTTLDACRIAGDEPFPLADRAPDDDAAILFTSGSTGTPKGVASKQAMFAAQVHALREMLQVRAGETDLQCFAAFALFDLCLGMTSVIPRMDLSKPAAAEPADIAACFDAWKPDCAFASPIVWLHLAERLEPLPDRPRFPSPRQILTVGAAIPPWLHEDLRQLLAPGTQVWTPYGATEGLPVAFIGTDEILGETAARTLRGEGTCVGRLAPGAEVRIVRLTDDPLPTWSDDLRVPAGTLGEIVIGGLQVSPEYKDAPAANAASKIRDGARVLHRMGDVGWLDERGRLWFCGRKAHVIRTPAGVLGADAIEGVFNAEERVFRTAAIGLGPAGRERVVLVVELRKGAVFDAALEAALRARAAGTPVEGHLARILPHPAFPTDARHNSKIRREDLRPWVAERCADLVEGT
jgi:acyl-CoA synthetase (AMP-forming)/AMP-acid ligase II